MSTEIVLAIISVIAAPIGALLSAIFLRKKYEAEVRKMDADTYKEIAGTVTIELDNARKVQEMLVHQLESLRNGIKTLQKEICILKKAMDKITDCPHSSDCPVRYELQNTTLKSNKQRKAKTNDERKGNISG